MQVTVYSTKPYDRRFLDEANVDAGHQFTYLSARLNPHTAMLQGGETAACLFVNDSCDATILASLAEQGCRLIALRCAGFNNVDLRAAAQLDVAVVRVPAYSPYAVAEHTLALLLSLNRKIHRAYNRVREGNFSLDGLLGFDVNGKTIGIVGTGKIGIIFARSLRGLGCEVVAHDPFPTAEFTDLGGRYVELPELWRIADVVSLHCPLTPETHHLVNSGAIAQMKPGGMLINTSRGGLIDTAAVINALKSDHLGSLALDVYEQEADLFFENLSETIIQDDLFQRLLTFPNVLITGHQAYFTDTALRNISEATVANLAAFEQGGALLNEVTVDRLQ